LGTTGTFNDWLPSSRIVHSESTAPYKRK
jgi:hypothetical protein